MKAKSLIPILSLLWLLGLIIQATAAATDAPVPEAEGIDVESVYSDPSAYKGAIKVRGVVMFTDLAEKLFDIIDYREYVACRVVDCTRHWVTVLFGGKIPAVARVVEITGAIEKNSAGKGGYVLRAKAVAVK